MEFLTIPERTKREREFGITSIADFGTPLGLLKQILDDYHPFIDIAKIGIGSAYVTPNLQEKVNLYKSYNIKAYCGGTLFEKCYVQRKIKEYAQCLKQLGIEWIEISNGTVDIPLNERLKLITSLKDEFNVIGEVGSKDTLKEMNYSEWDEELSLLLANGCKYVITEGRDSGTAGIYDCNGKIKKELIEAMGKHIDMRKVIFEAPTNKHQMYFINQFGPNVNLGNIKLSDVLVLEAQRCGLRSETFYLEDGQCNSLL